MTAVAETPTPAQTTPPPAVLQGGPTETPIPQTTQTPAAPAVTAPPATKEIYLGDRKFANMDDLAAYTRELQAKAAVADQLKGVLAPPVKQIDPDEQIADLIYSNPSQAIKQIRASAQQETLSAIQAQQEGERIRNKFYDDYKDLRGNEDFVNFYYGNMKKELEVLPQSEATLRLANAVRARIASIRGVKAATEELPNKAPVVVGQGSGAPTEESVPTGRTSMLDQMKAMRGSRKKK